MLFICFLNPNFFVDLGIDVTGAEKRRADNSELSFLLSDCYSPPRLASPTLRSHTHGIPTEYCSTTPLIMSAHHHHHGGDGHGHCHDEHDHSSDITPALQSLLYTQINFDSITTLNGTMDLA